MGDKPGGAKKPDLTPLFFLFLLLVIIGLGTVKLPRPSKDENKPGSAEQGETTIIQGGGCEAGGGSGCGGMQTEPIMITDSIDTIHEFTVVVECYEAKKDAYWEAGRLRASQVNNFVMEHKGAWHVCVGKYYSRKRAERQVALLKKHGVPNPVIFPPGKSKCVPPTVKIVEKPCDWCVFVIVIVVFIGLAIIAQCCKPKPPSPPKKCEVTTTTTTTTVTKTEIKDP